MSALTAKGLVKSYKNRVVVDGVNFNVNQGEIVGLLGPNGAGKTTSFYMMVGLIAPDHGTVSLQDIDVTTLPLSKRAALGLGYLPQESSIFRKLTVNENIMAVLELQPQLNKDQRQQFLEHLINEFKLTEIQHTLGHQLSGGERRRVEIARAIATHPKFILLDEPFAGVDPIAIFELKMLLKKLTDKNIGIFITDHNVRETLSICERAYIVNQGKVLAQGTPEALLSHQGVKENYLGEDFRW